MEPKNGVKTSEFWLVLLTVLLTLLLSSGLVAEAGTVAKVVGWAVSALAAAGYTFSRSMVKKAAAEPIDEGE